jgi:N-acetyl-alpha-D-muramate 1-phosphate uridylyltransferase
MSDKVSTCMILAAGLGSRLKPWTDHHPKALAIVNGKSLLQRNIEYLQSYGITNVVVNVHHFANQIIDAINQNNGWGSNVIISDETDEVLETGGGLIKAKSLLQNSENFLLMNCDILTNLNINDFYTYHLQHNAIATVAVAQRESSRNLLFNQNLELVGWRNNTTGEQKIPNPQLSMENVLPYAFSGVHILNQNVFAAIPFTGKFSMIDVYLHLCKNNIVKAYNHTNDLVLDVGKPEAIAKAEQLFV